MLSLTNVTRLTPKFWGGFMQNLIDELHTDHIKFGNVLDMLSEQLDIIQEGHSPDYHLLLHAVNFIEHYRDFALAPKEDAIFRDSTKDHTYVEVNEAINRLRTDNHELKQLAHKLHDYIDAALEDVIFEKEIFEKSLETCIDRQREHMNTEENILFPLLRYHS